MSEFTRTPWRLTKLGDILDKDNCMLFLNPKGLAMMKDARLMQNAPEMYEVLKNTAEYIFECAKLYKPFPDELCTYAEMAKELLARIDGEEVQK